jgi:chromosome segregation ATPase
LVKVDLPRMSIDMVKQRQMLNKSLKELQENLMLAFSKGAESEVAETLGQLTKQARLLDRMSFELQMQLSAQLSAMVAGVEELVSRAKTSVLCIDGTHQQVHLLQALTESELRQQLMQDSGHNAEREEMKMNRQLQELEGDLKAVIEELNSTQMLKSDCVEDLRGLKRKVQELEDEIIERQKSQDLLMSTLSRTEDELSEERVEMTQLPYALRAEMDVDFEDTVANAQAKAIMDAQLQNDISIALRIPKSQVEVLCYTRGHGTMAEVKISPATSIPSGVDKNDIAAHGKSGRALAEELQRQILDADSEIHYGLVGKRIKKIELHGPIAVPAARALRSALLEAYGDLARAEKDMLHAQEKFSVTSEKHRAAIKEEELIKQEIVSDCNARMKAASEGFRKQLDFQKEQVAKEQATVFKGLNRSLQDALDQHKLESRKKITELQATNHDLENELKTVREVLNAVEVKNSTLKIDVERAIDRLNHSERNFTQMKQACRKVDDILMPELSSCLMTLNNIESEMGFFHTRIMRALESSHSSQEFKSTEALRSKDVSLTFFFSHIVFFLLHTATT